MAKYVKMALVLVVFPLACQRLTEANSNASIESFALFCGSAPRGFQHFEGEIVDPSTAPQVHADHRYCYELLVTAALMPMLESLTATTNATDATAQCANAALALMNNMNCADRKCATTFIDMPDGSRMLMIVRCQCKEPQQPPAPVQRKHSGCWCVLAVFLDVLSIGWIIFSSLFTVIMILAIIYVMVIRGSGTKKTNSNEDDKLKEAIAFTKINGLAWNCR